MANAYLAKNRYDSCNNNIYNRNNCRLLYMQSQGIRLEWCLQNKTDITQTIRIIHSKTHSEIAPVIGICNQCKLNTPI